MIASAEGVNAEDGVCVYVTLHHGYGLMSSDRYYNLY